MDKAERKDARLAARGDAGAAAELFNMEDHFYKSIALQLALKPPANRPKDVHRHIVFMNFCDSFASRREFDFLCDAKERRLDRANNEKGSADR